MKKLIALILLVLSFNAFAQKTGVWTDETDEAYVINVVSDKASLDSADVFTSASFDALPIIAHYLSGNTAGYTGRDTTVNNYKHNNIVYATVIYNGSGTDSTGVVKLQGLAPDLTWNTFDTLATAGATPCSSPIYLFDGIPLYKDWRVTTTVADITASSYDATLYIQIIVPKPIRARSK